MVEKKLQFSDLREARAVLGMKDEFLKTMQREFPDCRIAVRGDTAMIVGSEQDVACVTEVFRVLRYLFRENTYLTTQHVRYSARLIKEGQSEALHNLYEDTVGISARGRLIKPKTLGQKRYVDSIRKNLVTFGIGPAGTGKTYLAVALAAFYLKNREVERIILTRPAVEAGEKLGFLPGDLQEKIDPYLRPLYDALADMFGYDQFQKMIDRNIIEVAPLAYMRGRTLEEALRRPDMDLERLARISAPLAEALADRDLRDLETVQVDVKYAGYLERQRELIARAARLESVELPADLDYRQVAGLSREVEEKLDRVRPRNLGQAGRISGVTPAAVGCLEIHLHKLGLLRGKRQSL